MSVAASTWAWEQIRERQLPNGQALVLLRIADHASSTGFAFPGVDQVAEFVAAHRSTVFRALGALEKAGLLSRQPRPRTEGRGRSTDAIQLHMEEWLRAAEQRRSSRPCSGHADGSADDPSPHAGDGEGAPGEVDQGRSSRRCSTTTNVANQHDQRRKSARPTSHPATRTNLRNRQEPSENRVGPRLTASPDAPDHQTPDPAVSDDAKRLVDLFVDRLNERTQRPRPYSPSRAWLVAMDRLIRLDGRSPDEIEAAIEWVHRDEFWRGNILSVPKLRERFDQLKLQARRQRTAGGRRRGERTAELIERARAGMGS